MILVDTSAWVDYLRAADTPVVETLTGLVDSGADLATTEPVIMELLAGAGKPVQAAAVEHLTNGLPLLGVDPRLDFRAAAALYAAARRGGRTIRSIVDCLIAAVAIRNDVPLLHQDTDFVVIAEIATLRVHQNASRSATPPGPSPTSRSH